MFLVATVYPVSQPSSGGVFRVKLPQNAFTDVALPYVEGLHLPPGARCDLVQTGVDVLVGVVCGKGHGVLAEDFATVQCVA